MFNDVRGLSCNALVRCQMLQRHMPGPQIYWQISMKSAVRVNAT